MSGPKHLWSGDWQRESEAASAARAPHRVEPAEPEATPVAPAPPRARRRRRRRRLVSGPIAVVAAVVALGGAAWGISSLLAPTAGSRAAASGSGSTTGTTAALLPQPTPSAVVSSRQVNWLGMQIVTQPPGIAVVQTVSSGTAADRAGIDPGDQILAIDGRAIHGATQISDALRGSAPGSRVTLQLAYGSAVSTVQLTLGRPPTVGP